MNFELTKKIIRNHHLVFYEADFVFIELHDASSFFNVASGYIDYLIMLEKQMNDAQVTRPQIKL